MPLLKNGLKGFVENPELFNDACQALVSTEERQSLGVFFREVWPDKFGINNYTSNSEKKLLLIN